MPTLIRHIARTTIRLATVAMALAVLAPSAQALVAYVTSRVEARSTNTHSVHVGMRDNWLIVDGDGTTDLDCWVYDARGVRVDSDTDDTDICVLETPGVGTHRLVIRNYGSIYNDYTVAQRQ